MTAPTTDRLPRDVPLLRAAARDELQIETVDDLRQAARVARWLAGYLDRRASVIVAAGNARVAAQTAGQTVSA